jgi:hypothetical protein
MRVRLSGETPVPPVRRKKKARLATETPVTQEPKVAPTDAVYAVDAVGEVADAGSGDSSSENTLVESPKRLPNDEVEMAELFS